MNQRVADIIKEIIRTEGKWSDDPADAGGATMYGVSLRYARSKGLMFDLDDDGDVDADDIRLISKERAFDTFYSEFYLEPRICDLPDLLEAQMTDYAVNSGPGQAVQSLQRVVTTLGFPTAVDGGLGPRTLASVNAACARHGVETVNNELVKARIAFLHSIVARKPSQKRFIGGWVRRAESFRA